MPVGKDAPGLEPLRDGLGHSKATGQTFWPGLPSEQLPPLDRLLFLPKEAKSVLGKKSIPVCENTTSSYLKRSN